MCKALSEFDQLLVSCYKNDQLGMGTEELDTLLRTTDALLDSETGERIFVFVCQFTDDVVEILFRPEDSDMIDYEALIDMLDELYSQGGCVGYDAEELEDGRIVILFDPSYHTYEDQLELVGLFEESICGEVMTPNYYGDAH